MKDLDAGLAAHFASGATTLSWAWRIERRDGLVFGFSDHDRTLSFAGVDFEPEGGFSASDIRAEAGLSVDAQDAEGALQSDRITEADIAAGLWDDAEVTVYRVNWADVSQRYVARVGAIGQVRRGRVAFVAEVRSLSHRLNQPAGRTLQFTCDADLGDARCGVDLDAASNSGVFTIDSVLSDRSFLATDLDGFADDLFVFGTVVWQTGDNAGRVTEVRGQGVSGSLVRLDLLTVPADPLVAGDTGRARAGCNKQFSTCRDRFLNSANFRGFPDIPGDDVVTRNATPLDPNTGNPL